MVNFRDRTSAALTWWHSITPEDRKYFCKIYYSLDDPVFVTNDRNCIRYMHKEQEFFWNFFSPTSTIILIFVMSITCFVSQSKNNSALCESAFSSNEASDRPLSIRAASFVYMDNEIFLPIKGYEGRYEISTLGRIKRLPFIKMCHGVPCTYREKFLSPSNTTRGYVQVTLSLNKIQRSHTIHRLLGIAFIPNPENKPYINHIDGIKWHNELYNLEWSTESENAIHAVRTGLTVFASEFQFPQTKLSNVQVTEIYKLAHAGIAPTILANQYNVSIRTISNIKTKTTRTRFLNSLNII